MVTYLACQVVGLRNSRDQDARLAMHQITSIVRSYERERLTAPALPQTEPQLGEAS